MLVAALLLPAGCSDAGLTTHNAPPLAAILSPEAGAVVRATSVAAMGSVSDPNHPPDRLRVEWRLGEAQVCADAVPDAEGYTTCLVEGVSGEVELSLRVEDPVGARDQASINLAFAPNGAPGAPDVTLDPEAPDGEDTLVASATGADPDGDLLTWHYAWFVDDVEVPEITGAEVPASWTSRGQTWRVEAWADDGTADGPRGSSPEREIGNSAPGAPTLEVGPVDPLAGIDPLVCVVVTEGVDPDGDAVTHNFAWLRDGVAWTGTAETTWSPGDTVPAAETRSGETFTCVGTATDGDRTSPEAQASLTPWACEVYRERDTTHAYGTLVDPRDGATYRTIAIAGVTWMADNLNYGTRIDAVDPQTDDGLVQRYCYGDTEAGCDQYGGYYARGEAIDWGDITVESVQGICPPGWHVPSVSEFEALFAAVPSSRALIDVCEGDRTGTDTVGFAGVLAGRRSWGSYSSQGSTAQFWTSTDRGDGGYSYNLVIGIDDTAPGDHWETGANPGENAMSVRCVAD